MAIIPFVKAIKELDPFGQNVVHKEIVWVENNKMEVYKDDVPCRKDYPLIIIYKIV